MINKEQAGKMVWSYYNVSPKQVMPAAQPPSPRDWPTTPVRASDMMAVMKAIIVSAPVQRDDDDQMYCGMR